MQQTPIFTSSGEWVAMLVDGMLYNVQGDWIGWVDEENGVFSVRGEYAGWLSRDRRVLRHRDTSQMRARRQPPPAPPRMRLPASVPLAPLMAELRFDTIDVFEDAPQRLEPLDLDQLDDLD